MMQFEEVIFRCMVETEAQDTFIDALLAYPGHELKIVSYLVQTHHCNLEDIKERVSGFKEQMVFEITLKRDEIENMSDYLKQRVGNLRFELQLLPLL